MSDPMTVDPLPEPEAEHRAMPEPEPAPKASAPDYDLPDLPPGLTPNQKVSLLSNYGQQHVTYGPAPEAKETEKEE